MEPFDPTVLNIDEEAIEEPYEYFNSLIQQVNDVNIQDFDYELFEKYTNELTEKEFEQVWNKKFIDMLNNIDDKYLAIDIDEFEESDSESKRIMLNKLIEFMMYVLPYKIVFSKIIKNKFSTINDLSSWIDKQDISELVSDAIEENIKVVNNMYNLIKNTIDENNKKNIDEYRQRLLKLRNVLEYENSFKDYFINLVKGTEDSKLKSLILKYYENSYV